MPVVCPGCEKETMQPRVRGAYECESCQGRYVSGETLERLSICIPVEALRTTPRRPRICFGCGKGMGHVRVAGVTLDRCDPCNAVYFDPGEFERVRDARATGGERTECDGCRRELPYAALTSRDGLALCESCLGERPRALGVGLSERDYDRARQHAAEARYDDTASMSTFDPERARRLSSGEATGGLVIDLLFSLFK